MTQKRTKAPAEAGAFENMLDRNSALAELRCATSGFEAVLLSVLRAKTVDFTGFFRFSRLG